MVLTAPRVYLASARGKVIGCLPSSARPTWNKANPASRPAGLGRRGHGPVLPWTYGPPHAGPVTAVPPPRTATSSVPCSLPPGSPAARAWAFPARAERAAGIGDYWCRHRASGPGARAARIIDRHRIASERDDLPGTGKAAAQDTVDAGHLCGAGRSRDPGKGPRRDW